VVEKVKPEVRGATSRFRKCTWKLLNTRYYHPAGMTTRTQDYNALEVPTQAYCQVIVLRDIGASEEHALAQGYRDGVENIYKELEPWIIVIYPFS
jgi:hypothetical protein